MSEKFAFLSEGKLNIFQNKNAVVLNSLIAESYKKKLKEIKMKNEWKRSGSGAKFMGMNFMGTEDSELNYEKLCINGISRHGNDMIAYSLNSGNVGGIYLKDISNQEEPETYILVKEKLRFYDIDINRGNNKIITSIADTFAEKHLALIDKSDNDFRVLTEGESFDSNPKWSGKDENIVYYDSCGLGYDSNGNFIKYGPKSVYRLNITTGDLTETLVGDKFEFYKPYEDEHGDLFCIKRPYSTNTGSQRMSLTDILLIPFKVMKAIFGWLNFFTQRYSGESLKTNGNNPAKANQRSPEQIFIDGNLLEVEKNLNQNKANGEKNPGYVPRNWELTVIKSGGGERVLKGGVLDYLVLADNSILYSNGKYIIKLHENGTEEIMAKAHLASALVDYNGI